tara:strand:- start:10333 stop:10497 length:165 start_codon:yes stop_codon:yes gene_type:complete
MKEILRLTELIRNDLNMHILMRNVSRLEEADSVMRNVFARLTEIDKLQQEEGEE